MEEKLKNIIKILTDKKQTIATMESCTGGGVVNAITNIEGASEILKFSAVTYSNEFKIKMGVDANIIEQYSVYSMETAKEMSKHISDFAHATYGIGITGKINRGDVRNPQGEDNHIFVSIYCMNNQQYTPIEIIAIQGTRQENKQYIIEQIVDTLLTIIK